MSQYTLNSCKMRREKKYGLERKCELEEDEDFRVDRRSIHNVISLMTEGMFPLTRNGTSIYNLIPVLQTPLHDATVHLNGKIVEILLRFGANVNETDVRNRRNEICEEVKGLSEQF